MGSLPSDVLGKAMTSRILGASQMIDIKRSKPDKRETRTSF